jgi:hypothetical protein
LEAATLPAFRTGRSIRAQIDKPTGRRPGSALDESIGDLLFIPRFADDVGMAVEACPSGFPVVFVVRHLSQSIGQSPPLVYDGIADHLTPGE